MPIHTGKSVVVGAGLVDYDTVWIILYKWQGKELRWQWRIIGLRYVGPGTDMISGDKTDKVISKGSYIDSTRNPDII